MRQWAWPAAIGASAVAWYASDSLRHRREHATATSCAATRWTSARRTSCAPARRSPQRRSPTATTPSCSSTATRSSRRSSRRSRGAKRDRQPPHLRLLARRHRARVAGRAVREGDARASRSTSCSTPSGRSRWTAALVGQMQRGRRLRRALPAAAPLRAAQAQQPHPPQAAGRRRRAGMIGGVGIAEEWTGNAQDPDHWRDTHVRVRGPVVRGLQGAFAENWLEATGDVLVGPDYLPELEPRSTAAARCSSCARGGGRRHERRGAVLPGAGLRSRERSTSPRPTSPRARRSSRRSATPPQRGVRTRVLVPGPHIDKEFVRVAGRAAYQRARSTAASRSGSTGPRCCTPRRWSSTAAGRRSAR